MALLKARGVTFEERRYLKDGVLEEDLNLLAGLEGILRAKEVEAGIDMSDPQAVRTLLATDPKPMQRPVLVHEGRAIIGRPPEALLRMLE